MIYDLNMIYGLRTFLKVEGDGACVDVGFFKSFYRSYKLASQLLRVIISLLSYQCSI